MHGHHLCKAFQVTCTVYKFFAPCERHTLISAGLPVGLKNPDLQSHLAAPLSEKLFSGHSVHSVEFDPLYVLDGHS